AVRNPWGRSPPTDSRLLHVANRVLEDLEIVEGRAAPPKPSMFRKRRAIRGLSWLMHSGLSRPSRSILAHAFGSIPAIQVYPGSCIRVYPGHTGLSWLMHSGLSRPYRSILAHAFGSIPAIQVYLGSCIRVYPGSCIRVYPDHSGPSWSTHSGLSRSFRSILVPSGLSRF
ncbi:hypothetical protein CRG98_047236, partial [Punica granatum]